MRLEGQVGRGQSADDDLEAVDEGGSNELPVDEGVDVADAVSEPEDRGDDEGEPDVASELACLVGEADEVGQEVESSEQSGDGEKLCDETKCGLQTGDAGGDGVDHL